MKTDNTESLKKLGSSNTDYHYDKPSVEILETFKNQFPDREYQIVLKFKEFTSLCPKTGQPDFGKIIISYSPNEKCIETKSLKLYLFAFRQSGTFMETIVNTILDDCVKATEPRHMRVTGQFAARGGIKNIVYGDYSQDE